ncbi:MAG: SpoVA/SpoVAEb family sporulation membrane protein [Ruminococcaceae bacterium]|nr:SpoVA/SpoVAEb family sporulation membrane protein [Oscillospiraceae bacterium]
MGITEQFLLAFVSGGLVCVVAQLLIDLTKLTPARILVLYVSFGVLLYAIGIYEPMQDLFGAGVSVPLIGFGANIGRGVKEAVMSDGLLGAITGGLSSSAAGITAALILGLLASILFKTKSKRM